MWVLGFALCVTGGWLVTTGALRNSVAFAIAGAFCIAIGATVNMMATRS